MLKKHGFEVVYKETDGAHTWINWRNYSERVRAAAVPISDSMPPDRRRNHDDDGSVKARCLLMAVLGLIAAANAGAADVTGEWKAEFDTQIGVQKYTYTLKQDGDKVTGKANSDIAGEKREVELKEGKLDGDTITFVEIFDFQGNELRIEYKGKVAGDEIKFTRNVGEFATEEFVAKRGRCGGRPAPAESQPVRRRSGAAQLRTAGCAGARGQSGLPPCSCRLRRSPGGDRAGQAGGRRIRLEDRRHQTQDDGLHAAGLFEGQEVPGALPAPRHRRQRVGLDADGQGRDHPGQPLRRQEGGPDDRRDAQRPGVGRAGPRQPVRGQSVRGVCGLRERIAQRT